MAADAGGAASGETLSDLYQNARKLLLKASHGLEALERREFSSFTDIDLPEFSLVNDDISRVRSLCEQMNSLILYVIAKPQRSLWIRKVNQVSDQADFLKSSLDKYQSRIKQRSMEALERAELLGKSNRDSAHVMRIFDEEAQAIQSARSSSTMLEELQATGEAILHNYANQRDRLKSAQRKALDVLNTVGLSNSVLKLIERRHRMDKWVKYAGMVFTIFIMFAMWWWS